MKTSRRLAAIGASAAIALSAFAAPASAYDFTSISSTNKELSDRYDIIPCGVLEFGLNASGVLEEGMYNAELRDALVERGEGPLVDQFPQVGDWNEQSAADLADRAQKCELVKADTWFSGLSSGSS